MKLKIDYSALSTLETYSLYDSYKNEKKKTQLPLLLTHYNMIYNQSQWLNQISLFNKNMLYL
jgi:hypothetical protein